jgi:hypothetical protein
VIERVAIREPDDVSIQAAIEANDVLIATLETIRDLRKGLR